MAQATHLKILLAIGHDFDKVGLVHFFVNFVMNKMLSFKARPDRDTFRLFRLVP